MPSLPTFPLPALCPTVAALLDLPAPAQTTLQPIVPITDSIVSAERVAVLAPDALGLHPFTLWRQEMPFLDTLHQTRSLTLRSIMPSITPVNFAGIVSGVELEVHGIRAFTDDFQCETLFDVIRASGGISAGVGQEGYTGSELLGRNADLWGKAESHTDAEVMQIALSFAQRHPRFLIVQLGSTDDIFHKYGPSSPEGVPVVRQIDGYLQQMVRELLSLGYAVIVTADHGQHDCDTSDSRRGTHGSASDDDTLVPCTWVAP